MDGEEVMLNNCNLQPGAETVYGTDDTNLVMSDKVQQLAGSIYQEFERMINRYDEDVVKNLMPLLVNVLECLDASYRINQEQDVELELLREDNEQLVTQYEREKNARKLSEQKLLESEDFAEQENKELASRLESLESIVRMLELKHKNSLEHAGRLEERESELKKEYNKLHERYTELFKNHVDYIERTKMLMGSTHSQMSSVSERMEINRTRLNPAARSSGPVSYDFASLDNSVMMDTETICSVGSNTDDSGPPSLQNEIDNLHTAEKAAETDSLQQQNRATSPQNADTSPIVPNIPSNVGRSTTKKESRSANSLYQELFFQDNDESEDNDIVTGSWVHPGEYASSANDNYFGMGKEMEKFIMENNELLATKNALNIVKDDLIAKVDELTGEIEIFREELNAMQQSRNKLRTRVHELEDELKKTKEQVKQQSDNDQEENGVPLSERKRFTRMEMAVVIMERNQYKERFMELQEALHLSEIIRASRTVELDKKSKHGIWKYFSSLFTSSNRPQERVADGHGGGPFFRSSSPSYAHGSPSRNSENRLAITGRNNVTFFHTANSGIANALPNSKDYYDDGTSERARLRRHVQYQLRSLVHKEDGRMNAYDWSLPTIKIENEKETSGRQSGCVPVLMYCNSLAESSNQMKVFCAAGVNLNGGFTKTGQSVIPASSPYAPRSTAKIAEITSPTAEHSAEALDRQITCASLEHLEPETQLSSYVWICTSTRVASTVTVVDANQFANVLDVFPVCSSHLLCIASVPGAMETDYALLENSEIIKAGEMLERPGEGPYNCGNVEYIRVKAKGDNCNTKEDNTNESVNLAINAETPVEEKAKEATEKSNEANTSVPLEPLCNVNEIKIRQAIPGAPQRLQLATPTKSTASNLKNNTTSLNKTINQNVNDASETIYNNNNNNHTTTDNTVIIDKNNLSNDDIAKHINNHNHTTTENRTSSSNNNSNSARFLPFPSPVNPILNTKDHEEPLISSVGPTMWLGAQNGWLYVHSSVGRWHQCLHKVELPNAVLSLIHIESRVVVALANAQLAVFRRQTDGQWDLNNYHLVTLGDKNHAIRCLCVAGEKIWAAHRNKIFIIDPISLNIIHSLDAHPRKESLVRQMAATGAGVWVSIRLDSTLRLYHTYTFEHKQDVDIEPYVSKMLGTGKLGFSFVRITALMVSCNRLWIGTGNGVIISVPLSEMPNKSNDALAKNQLPLCCMANAQLSFHGHRDAVKFFVSIPMHSPKNTQLQFTNRRPDMLVMCGGEGYIDFRLNDSDIEKSIHLETNETIGNRIDKSYLIVWHVNQR